MNLPSFTENEISAEKIVISFTLTEDNKAFEGHFPGYPILPGVIQLDWVMHLALRYFKIDTPAAQNFQVKFQNIISFGPVYLTLILDRDANRLSFTYSALDVIYSSGKIKL